MALPAKLMSLLNAVTARPNNKVVLAFRLMAPEPTDSLL